MFDFFFIGAFLTFLVYIAISWESGRCDRSKTRPKRKESLCASGEKPVHFIPLVPLELEKCTDFPGPWNYSYQVEMEKHSQKVIEEMRKAEGRSCCNRMIPLCVPYGSRELARSRGAIWNREEKTWFWPFLSSQDPVKEWLPQFYAKDHKKPLIVPNLVPRPLFGKNLRTFLPQSEWDKLQKSTFELSGNRCVICGCKHSKWPVECHEIWEYDDNYSPDCSMAFFAGLQSVCPGCYRIYHFSKEKINEYKDPTIARIMVLNQWSLEHTEEAILHAFDLWEIRSNRKWVMNFDVLAHQYGYSLPHKDLLFA